MKKLELKNIIREEVRIAKKIYEANKVVKSYKPGDKISVKKYNNFDKKDEIIHGKVESVKNGVIKYTYSDFAGQQWGTVKIGDKNIVETSASGNAGPYMTPKAFTKPGQDYEGSPAANAMKDWTKTKRIDEGQMKFSWPNVSVGDRIVDINDEKFKVLKKEKNRIFVKDLQSPNDEFWIEKDYAVKNGKYIIEEQVDFKDENFSPKQKMAQAIRTVRESLKEVEKIVDKSRVFKEENNIKSVDMYKRSHAALKKIGEQMNRIANKMQAIK